jgi:threonine/homoserine/homoserine lactone efflux protein
MFTMDPQSLFNIVVTAGVALIGWLAREMWGAIKELRKDIHKIEIELPSAYIRRDEFSEGIKEIKDICRQIFDRLENKADKER